MSSSASALQTALALTPSAASSSSPSTTESKSLTSTPKTKSPKLRDPKKLGVQIGKTKIMILTTKPGDATHFPKEGDTVRVHYVICIPSNSGGVGVGGGASSGKTSPTAASSDLGICVDSSRLRNKPYTFILSPTSVIKSLVIALPLMSRGQIAVLTVPQEYGYGVNGYPPVIPANVELKIEVELISFCESVGVSVGGGGGGEMVEVEVEKGK